MTYRQTERVVQSEAKEVAERFPLVNFQPLDGHSTCSKRYTESVSRVEC